MTTLDMRSASNLPEDFLTTLGTLKTTEQIKSELKSLFQQNFQSHYSIHLTNGKQNYMEDPSVAKDFSAKLHQSIILSGDILQDFEPATNEYALGFPLSAMGVLTGSLVVMREGKNYTAAERAVIEKIALGVSLFFQSSVANNHQRDLQKKLSLITSVTSKIANISNLETLTKQICLSILEVFGFYYVAVFIIEQNDRTLSFRASARSPRSAQPAFEIPAGMKLSLGDHIVGYVAQSGDTLLSNDVSKEPRYGHLESLPETKAELAIPLKIGSTVIGVLDIQSDERNVFEQNDVVVLSALADSLALAVQQVRLYNDLSERTDQMSVLANVTRSLSSILDFDQLLNKVVQLIHTEFGFQYVHIFLIDHVQNKITFKTGSGKRALTYCKEMVSFDLDAPVGIIPATIRSGQLELVSDVSQEPRFLPDPISHSRLGSELTIPLVFAGETFGTLDVQSDEIDAFSDGDVEILATLAASISIAIRNAKLYNSEKWRRQIAEKLQEIAALLSEKVELEEVLKVILRNIQDILPCDLASVWLLDKTDSHSDEFREQKLVLKVGQSNDPSYSEDNLLGLTSVNAWFFDAFKQDIPLIRSKKKVLDPLQNIYGFPPDFSAIAAPLTVNGIQQGVLTLHHHTANRYGKEAQKILSSFSGYTAAAIENARLFQESQDQAWISTILLQVAKATQSLTSIDELTSISGQLIKLLIGGKDGGIFLYYPEDKTYYLQSVFGEAFNALGLSLPHKFARPPEFEQVATSRLPIALPGSIAQKDLTELLPIAAEDTLLLLPLVAHNELLGILMHVSADSYQQEIPENVLGKQKYAILQGIAQQIAVSIQNINLLEARQEETYISAVLLQVSQTIVSTPVLSEALDKVYYTLHMLAGVEGCVIFQLLPDNETYQLMHIVSEQLPAYQLEGFIGKTFTKSQFPFLYDIDEEKPTVVDTDLVMEGFQMLSAPVLSPEEQIDSATLKPGNSVYFIFNLSVRGEKYGVLIYRDPDLPKRERRLELLNGVAQQISFAFQNERLQQARTDQEKVEREFQLARQIQETFLPENLPVPTGYELDASWQTARQVGGDFYDVFEIKPGLLGLVIADVSDKGMAAAMFMTVSRTLIRTIALDLISPARTLERVNELLQLDSKRGFFVTCFYGVLEPKTGRLVYCNAGHMPPYHLNSASGQVTPLKRGGIALGVMESISLPEHALIFSPGDGLVLYTDGITEATNKLGNFYGSKRYVGLLQKYFSASSSEIIRAVTGDLERFRHHAPLSDDVTQVVLRRFSSPAQ